MQNKIRFLDLKKQTQGIEKKILNSIKNNITSSSFIGGNDLSNFEKEFSKYLNIKYCLGVANGTDALEIAIKALNLKKNSEVIVQANTWISTAEAVMTNDLKVVFVDVDETHNICIKDLTKKINKRTSAIIVVHLFGNPANIEKIIKISRDKYKNIKIIEDCAQSHGAKYGGKKVSTFGDISTFSFFPSKNLGCYGDGGCLVTNNKRYYLASKKISNHGGLKKNSHTILGRNSRLDNIQAGILRVKLKKLDLWIKIRNQQAKLYLKYLSKISDIECVRQLKNTKSSHHLFVIKTKKRNELRDYLKMKNISTGIHYPLSLPEVPAFKSKYFLKNRKMNSIKYSKKIISLPIGEHLTLGNIKKVSLTIKDFFNA